MSRTLLPSQRNNRLCCLVRKVQTHFFNQSGRWIEADCFCEGEPGKWTSERIIKFVEEAVAEKISRERTY